jgi:CubicO group peptidase (beta-lactamase class C family)
MTVTSVDLQERLEEVIARHDVPGASAAVLAGGEVATAAAGVLNLDTGVPVTEDSLFQIGSITKPYTTTLVMQLVDEGRIELDAPVRTYLPELQLADAELTETVTVRHLLNHTSGIAGDHFPDLGRGDDVVERYVASCAEIGKTHPLGATMSYCNAAFVIAGRIIERLTGTRWDDALAERLVGPLGVDHTYTLPEDVIRFRSALGHLDKEGQLKPAHVWGLPRSCGPCGLICATASDVIAFARMHLDDGRSQSGEQVLSAASVAAMQQPEVEMPDRYIMGSHFGLAWMLYDWGGHRVYGHDGGTVGQIAFLRIVPEAGVAICVLTNGGHAQSFFEDLARPLLDELAGVPLPYRLAPPDEPVELDLDRYVGVYERIGSRIEIERRNGALAARFHPTGPLTKVFGAEVTEPEIVAVQPGVFLTRQKNETDWVPMVFYDTDDGSSYLHTLARATPKSA